MNSARLFTHLPKGFYSQRQFQPERSERYAGLDKKVKVLSFNFPSADPRVHRFDEDLEIYGITKSQRQEIDRHWFSLKGWQLNRAHYRQITAYVLNSKGYERGVIECVKDGADKTVTFTGAYQGNYDGRYDDGIATGGGGGGGDLSSNQIYVLIPKFTVSNPTLASNAGFTTWPWDPRTRAHQTPAAWPSSESAGSYFVDNSHVNATDTNNSFGYPDRPRLTRPTTTNLPAGTLIEFGGGTIDNSSYGFDAYDAEGTAENPVFIRGSSGLAEVDMPRIIGHRVRCEGASYLIFENFRWDGENLRNTVFATSENGNHGDTDHIVIRNCVMRNLLYQGAGGAIIGVSADDRNGGQITEDIVVYNNKAFNCGENVDWATQDADQAFVGVTTRLGIDTADNRVMTTRVWVLDNEADTISGNLVQCISIGDPLKDWRQRVRYVWVGGNTGRNSRQCVAWAKRCQHVIFSQNKSSGNRQYEGGNGQGMGCQYGPDELWMIANEIWDSAHGIQQTSTPEPATPGTMYAIGNLIRDLRNFIDYNPATDANDNSESGWTDGTAFTFWAENMNRYILLNSVYDACNGIKKPYTGSSVYSSNNLFELREGEIESPITPASNNSYMYHAGDLSDFTVSGDVVYQRVGTWRARSANTTYNDVGSLNALGTFSGALDDDPVFTDPASGDFAPGALSPALNSGSWIASDGTDIRQRAIDLYGLDIAFDYEGLSRSTTSPDKGAREAA